MSRHEDAKRSRELFRQLADGGSDALAGLYDLHAPSLFRHALALERRRSEAEDLVHGVFVKIADLGPALRGVRAPAAYLHRMLHTTWIDRGRRTSAARRLVADRSGEPAVVPAHDTGMDVTRALDALPLEQREVVVLHALDGFSFLEVGRMTGVSLFTAAARYRLATAKLRTILRPL